MEKDWRVYAQPAFASGGEVKVVEGDVNGE